jgi:folate-binding protein YgfZ
MPPILQSETASPTAQLDALLHHAAIAPLSDTGWLRVTGSDRVRWLNGMVTNSIQSLSPGEGNYNFALNAQGRIQADLTAFALEDSILLETTRDQIAPLLAHLDHFIIMDDVELRDATAERAGLLLAGPDATKLLAAIDISSGENYEPLELILVTWHSSSIDLIHAHSPLIPRFEIWTDPATLEIVRDQLQIAGATPVTPAALEHLRLLSGTPRYGIDIRNTEKSRDLPQETNQPHALNFTKGCYLGQEIVERIHSRGAVHRTLTGLQLTGPLPTPGTILEARSAAAPEEPAKPVGEITSAALIPLATGPIQLALAYLRREALAEAHAHRLTLTYPSGTATPIPLPYSLELSS